MSKNKHLTLADRHEIMHYLNQRIGFKAIGRLIGKDCTTISKEVKGHLIFEKKVHLIDPLMIVYIVPNVEQIIIFVTIVLFLVVVLFVVNVHLDVICMKKKLVYVFQKHPMFVMGALININVHLKSIFTMQIRLIRNTKIFSVNPDQVLTLPNSN